MISLLRGANMKKNIIIIISIILLLAIITSLIINKQSKGEFIKLNYKEIKEKLNNKEDFILVISRTTCSHCLEYKPKVQEISINYNIKTYYIDIDEETKTNKEKLLEELDLDGSTPITLFIKNGKEASLMDRINGNQSKQKTIEKFKKMGFIKK